MPLLRHRVTGPPLREGRASRFPTRFRGTLRTVARAREAAQRETGRGVRRVLTR
jgi:hypothetical protein